jgi:endonuclease/exonuclease/phosphatase family metal-dependent hydrolase
MVQKTKHVRFRGLKMGIVIFSLFIALLIIAFVSFYFWAGSSLLTEEELNRIIPYSGSANPALQSPQIPENGIFTIMTYNIGYLSGMLNNKSLRAEKSFFEANMATFLRQVEKIRPDIIGFQEIDYDSHRSYHIDQLRMVAEAFGYQNAAKAVNWDRRYVPFPFWPPKAHFGEMQSGQAVLSRWPILEAKRVVLQKPGHHPFYYSRFYLDRLVQVVKVEIGTHQLIVLNVHLEAFSRKTRKKQAAVLLDIYRSYKDRYPVLLIGDFNTIPPGARQTSNFSDEPEVDFTNEKTIRMFLEEPGLKSAFLQDKNRDSGSLFTFPSNGPTRKLDYIFYTHEKIENVESFIPEFDSSDHYPLVMRFKLK